MTEIRDIIVYGNEIVSLVENIPVDEAAAISVFADAADLGFAIDEDSLQRVEKASETARFESVDVSLARDSLQRIIMSDSPKLIMKMYKRGVLKWFLPEMDICFRTEQNNPHHKYNVGVHTVRALMSLKRSSDKERNAVARFSTFFHDIGKPVVKTTNDEGIDRFIGHPEKSAEITRAVMERFGFEEQFIKKVCAVVKFHEFQIRQTVPGIRKAMEQMDGDLFPVLFDLREADILAQSGYQNKEKWRILGKYRNLYEKAMTEG